MSPHPEVATTLAMALVTSSAAPIVLLNDELIIIGISASFCTKFEVGPLGAELIKFRDLGEGEWSSPQLEALLIAAANGNAAVDGYEMDLVRPNRALRRLVVSAHRLDYFDPDKVRLVVSVLDITEARLTEKLKDELARDKQVLMQELQHRIANSLQIIASVLMQSARKVQSEETKQHLRDAHNRVLSIATLQRQLAEGSTSDVVIRSYLVDLCRSIGASMISDPKQMTLTVTSDDSVIASDVSVSLGLIVTELVINALKHAFPDNQSGAITVDYAAKDGGWKLMIGDNGIGMPSDAEQIKPGLGTSIVDAIAHQLDATVAVTDANPGTLVSITHSAS